MWTSWLRSMWRKFWGYMVYQSPLYHIKVLSSPLVFGKCFSLSWVLECTWAWLFTNRSVIKSYGTIQVLEDTFRACVIYFEGQWDTYLSLCEFTDNNRCHSNIDIALFKVLYGRRCRFLIEWFDEIEVRLLGIDMLRDSMKKIRFI